MHRINLREGVEIQPERTEAELWASLSPPEREDFQRIGVETPEAWSAFHERGKEMGKRIFEYMRRPDAFEGLDDRVVVQKDALAKIASFLGQGRLRGRVVLPTGIGKTVLFGYLSHLVGRKTLIVVPRLELMRETLSKFERYFSDLGVKMSYLCMPNYKVEGYEANDPSAEILVAVYDSFKNRKKRAELTERGYEMIIFDEAHNHTRRSEASVQDFPGAVKLAFTATPDKLGLEKPVGDDMSRVQGIERDGMTYYRELDESISMEFPHEILRMGVKDAILKGYLAPVLGAGVEIDPDDPKALLAALRDMLIRPREILGIDGFQGKKTLITLDSRKEAAALTRMLNADPAFAASGRRAGFVASGKKQLAPDEPNDDRTVKMFRGEGIDVLISVDKVKEGFDAPRSAVLLNGKIIRSADDYAQVAGRVLRLDENDPFKQALIADVRRKGENSMNIALFFGKDRIVNGEYVDADIDPYLHDPRPEHLPRYGTGETIRNEEMGDPGPGVFPDAEGYTEINHETVRSLEGIASAAGMSLKNLRRLVTEQRHAFIERSRDGVKTTYLSKSDADRIIARCRRGHERTRAEIEAHHAEARKRATSETDPAMRTYYRNMGSILDAILRKKAEPANHQFAFARQALATRANADPRADGMQALLDMAIDAGEYDFVLASMEEPASTDDERAARFPTICRLAKHETEFGLDPGAALKVARATLSSITDEVARYALEVDFADLEADLRRRARLQL